MRINVTESCVVGPAACSSKANKQARWPKGNFAGNLGGGWLTSVQRPAPPTTTTSWGARAFMDRSGEGATCHHSTVSSDSHLQTGHRGSGRHHPGCLGPVNLHFQSPLIPISLRPVLGIVAAHVLGAVRSSCS